MHIGLFEATALAVALLAIDVAARSLRVVILLRALGVRMRVNNAFGSTLFSDAAAVVTPLRAGGSPARVASLRAAGVPMATALRALGIDLVSYYAVVAGVCALLGVRVIPSLLSLDGPLLPVGDASLPLWGIGALAILFAGALGHLWAPRAPRSWGKVLPGALLAALWRPLLVTTPLALLSVGCRIAVLPLFVLTGPQSAEVVDLLLWSAMLTYGQNFVPIPAGAGVVDAALRGGLVGGAGWFGAAYVVWRTLTVAGVAVLGFAIALLMYGRPVVLAAFRRRAAAEEGEG